MIIPTNAMKIIKIKTAKGKDGIEINDFRYRKDKVLVSGEISWRCPNRNCSASLKTNSAVTIVKQKPSEHNHSPPDKHIPSSPSTSEPSTPTSLTPIPQTPTSETDTSLEHGPPSLTSLLSPYITLTPEPPKFPQLDEENKHLRQKIAELSYTNSALTDRLIDVEKKLLELNENQVVPVENDDSPEISDTEKIDICTSEFSFKPGIHVLEADMGDIIDTLKHNKCTVFAHTISKDFEDPRRMSAGVAVVFKKRFGKPGKEDILTENLAYQNLHGASVYSLLTKSVYYGKPTLAEYNLAFDDFQTDFAKKGFKTLICSPMGCVRDLIRLDHFARKIVQFQVATGANILIVTKDQMAQRKLRHGLSHHEFMKQLRRNIANAQNDFDKIGEVKKKHDRQEETDDPQITAADWYKLDDEEMKMYLEQIQVPDNVRRLDITVSHMLKINNDQQDTAKELRSLTLDTYDYVLAAVNDRENEAKEGGTHWSLLFYVRENNTYYHLDSVEPLNRGHAQRLAVTLSGDADVSVVQLRCRQQDSGVECGAYVVHYTELICSMVMNNIGIVGGRCFTQKFAINKIYNKIKQLKQSQKIVQVSNQSNTSKATKSKPTNKVTLLSDSHGRNLRHLLQNQLGENCAVYSVVKPSGRSENVVSDLDYEAQKLKKNDHLIVMSGSNDLDRKTDFNVKEYVQKIAAKTKSTNVIVCSIPLRYDKPHLNVNIRNKNIELVIESLKYDHLKVLSLANISPKNYSSRGIHLNKWGKYHLCKAIVAKLGETNLNE